MESSANRWWEGLTLVVILAVVVAIAHSFLTWPSFPLKLATTAPPPASSSVAPETPAPTASLTPSPTPLPTSTPTSTPRPTHTPTPSPPEPTATATLHPTELPKGMPTPITFRPGTMTPTPVVVTQTNAISMTLTAPEPLPLLNQPENATNILLLGSDQRGMDRIGRTDTIIIATIHPDIPAVSLLSIPRDFYAWIPGQGFGKINTAFSQGGPALLEATILHNFGVKIDYYARIGFDSFIEIVDTLGGVTVAVECPLHDTFVSPEVHLEPGIHRLDGRQTLRYVRSRRSTSDFDRHRRQQQVLRGIYRKALNLGVVPKIPALWGALKQNISTDLDLQGILRLGAIGRRLNTLDVKSRFVGGGAVEAWTGPEGLYILIPNVESLQSVVSEALAPPAKQQEPQRPRYRVEVVDGTPNEGWDQVAARRLRWEGFDVVGVQPADEIRPRTQIVDLRTPPGGWPLSHLMRLYGRDGSDVISRPTEQRDVDFQILLGADYDPCIAVRGR